MRRGLSIALTVACVLLWNVIPSHLASAKEEKKKEPTPTVYNPYPAGILPSDLTSEIIRVQHEVRGIFDEALLESKALPPPVFAGNPPALQGSGYASVEILGKLMNFDQNISPFRNIACASCHMPYAAFSGPIPSVNLTMIAYPGTFHFRAGKRTAMRYTYSPDFPVLEFSPTQSMPGMTAVFTGGNFWDARATGVLLQSPDAQQAQGPPLDSQEMGFPARLALRSGFPAPGTDRSLRRYGVRVP
jgi:cytochrome c peroxidase